jgi:branched-chain amino acid transport system permease protein
LTGWRTPALAVLAWLLLLCLPFVSSSEYLLDTGIAIATFAVLSTGLNLIYGYAGLLSFAQVAFFGLGGYTAALLVTRLDCSFWLALPASVVVATLAGLLIGCSSLRLSRHAFAIVSLTFALLCGIVSRDWVSLTRGSMGIPGLSLAGFDAPTRMYRLMVTAAAILLAAFYVLLSSRLGRALRAIKLNEPLAQSQGIDPLRYKLLAIGVSAAASGVMGALFVFHLSIVDPSVFDFYYTETMLIMVILGGAGSFWGVIGASVVFSIVPDLLRFSSDLRLMLYGVVLVAAMLLFPTGFGGLLQQRRVARSKPPQ